MKKLHFVVVDIFNSNLGRLFSTCDKSMSRSTLLGAESVQERHSSIIGPRTKQWTAGAPIMKIKHIFFVLGCSICVVFCRSLFVLCPLYCLTFDVRLLITHVVSSNVPDVYSRFPDLTHAGVWDWPVCKPFCFLFFVFCFVFVFCVSVLSVLLRYTHSGCPFDIFKLFLFALNFEASRHPRGLSQETVKDAGKCSSRWW
jgi:hypothetical protein